MTEQEWAIAYALQFGNAQLSYNWAEGETAFIERMALDLGVPFAHAMWSLSEYIPNTFNE